MIAIVQRQARAWEQRDAEGISGDFAPDGVLITPSGRWVGPGAVREAAESFFANATDIKVHISRIVVDGDQGAIEWTWSETDIRTGQQRTTQDAIIFMVQEAKIAYWREYID